MGKVAFQRSLCYKYRLFSRISRQVDGASGGCTPVVVGAGKPDILPAVIRMIKAYLRTHDQSIHVADRHQKTGGSVGEMDGPFPVPVLIKSRNALHGAACRQQFFCQFFIAKDRRALIAVFLNLLLREPAL